MSVDGQLHRQSIHSPQTPEREGKADMKFRIYKGGSEQDIIQPTEENTLIVRYLAMTSPWFRYDDNWEPIKVHREVDDLPLEEGNHFA